MTTPFRKCVSSNLPTLAVISGFTPASLQFIYSAEIWKRFRKWGGVPTGATQNPKDLLSSPEIENILENSDFIYLLNLSAGDRKLMTERLNISAEQLAYVTNADPGSGLLFFQNVILPFRDEFPKDTELYKLLTTKPSEVAHDGESG